jgi:hypothetical protein
LLRSDDTEADSSELASIDPTYASCELHYPRCGRPPRLQNTADPGLYHAYFEKCYGEPFVRRFDRATGTGTVWCGDLDWDEPRSFTLDLLDVALRETQGLAAQVAGLRRTEASGPPVIDAAPAPGRYTGLTGKDEVVWLRACLAACTTLAGYPADS